MKKMAKNSLEKKKKNCKKINNCLKLKVFTDFEIIKLNIIFF